MGEDRYSIDTMIKNDATSIEEKLDSIIAELRHINRRERLRTAGGIVRFLISIIPIAIMLFGLWYAYRYTDELLNKVAQAAARQAAAATQQNAAAMLDTSALDTWIKQYLQ